MNTMKSLSLRAPRSSEAGFTLMELLIVISIMLILMLIAIPNYLHLTRDANQTSAIQSLRAIQEAEVQYHTDYPQDGYACALSALGGNSKAGNPTPQASQLLPNDLTSGSKSGYLFSIGNCTKTTVNNHDMFTSYEATAVPQAVGKTGQNGYCLDMNGEITIDPSGGTNCTVPLR
jgi:type IV pilus assembly protein PilA